ncbi:hypothetical protein A6A04_20805 [Paramagnetospirillum marisnigri]|jgi:hypothetical protein|uniref:Antitoxin Xre/MbcA/ParS-like toxin-binding domain-containing protein n=2 Tax=Paramagnetospirillum TaxID=3031148 RepID=A0A178MBJ1_9PROT|nr:MULTISPECIES: MbcA/ParS/Xre antitoxin family protein [Paramagnetospirillum]KIL96661.1 hypothetical protein CCC_01924 [Paramagnetospirillum magnetotacticum MS-1]OAN45933.1 hypothetical protein A6A04_20805 [Paramagnetospirillum marisnigri]
MMITVDSEPDREAKLAEIVAKIRQILVGDDPRGIVETVTPEPPQPVLTGISVGRAHRLTLLANHVFGDEDKACIWLTEPQERFGGKSLMQLAENPAVADHIEEALRRIHEEQIFKD